MLRSLRIKNLALVDDLRWELGEGFNILTGETGAGKSILIDGLNLLLGVRADKTLIRSGEDTCVAEAEFEISDSKLSTELSKLLAMHGAEPCEGARLLLKRTLTASGANRQFANGSAVTLAALKAIGDLLVDVHGPHDHQSLLHNDRQLAILDAYGKWPALLDGVEISHDRLRALQHERESLVAAEKEKSDRIEILAFQAKEIAEARLREGEDESVENDYRIARGARDVVEHAAAVANLLAESEEGSVLSRLALVEKSLVAWQRIDTSAGDMAALNRAAVASLQDLLDAARQAADRVDMDPAHLAQLEERLNLLQRLKRKYGPALDDVIRHGQDVRVQLEALESSAERLQALEKEETVAKEKLAVACEALGAARRKIAAPLAKNIQDALRSLGFAKALFRIDLAALPTPTRAGADRVEFIFAPNPGEQPRPLRSIASSGEMARVMLAVKATLAQVDEVPVLVFDEVDANVGGETATEVARSLRALGHSHQVLCITHLPQVAAQGRHHFAVTKSTRGDRTITELQRLTSQHRLQEIARMLGGKSTAALTMAEALVNAATD